MPPIPLSTGSRCELKREIISVQPENANTLGNLIPRRLAEQGHWVLWKAIPRNGSNKFSKVPIDPKSGLLLSGWHFSCQQLSLETAVRLYSRGVGDGVGFVFTGSSGLVGIDIDDAVDADGATVPFVEALLANLNAPVELSFSGNGLHAFVDAPMVADLIMKSGRGKKSFNGHDHGFGQLELFTNRCFIALTGHFLPSFNSRIPTADSFLGHLLETYWPYEWPPRTSYRSAKPTVKAQAGIEGKSLSNEDLKILERARSAQNGQKFRRLYGISDSPEPTDRTPQGYKSRSEAELALARILVFWCCSMDGSGLGQVECFMRTSQLRRAKWDEQRGESTWLEQTIQAAFSAQLASKRGFWNGKHEKRAYRRKQTYIPPKPPVPKSQLEKLILSDDVLYDLGLKTAVIGTYKELRSFNFGGYCCFPSEAKLASKLRCTERTIRNHINALVKAGVLVKGRYQGPYGKRGKGNMYWFTKVPENPSGENGSKNG